MKEVSAQGVTPVLVQSATPTETVPATLSIVQMQQLRWRRAAGGQRDPSNTSKEPIAWSTMVWNIVNAYDLMRRKTNYRAVAGTSRQARVDPRYRGNAFRRDPVHQDTELSTRLIEEQ